MLAGLALFDAERGQINQAWAWIRQQAGQPFADGLLLEYVDATVYTGELRYEKRAERIPQLTLALEAARRLDRPHAETAALGNLGVAYAALEEFTTALSYFVQQRDRTQTLGDQRGLSDALGNLGATHLDLGQVDQAIPYFEQQLALTRILGDRRRESIALGNLGVAYTDQWALQQAIGYFEQQLTIARALGDQRGESNALGNLGTAYSALGKTQRAGKYYEQALAIARALGDQREVAIVSWNLGRELENRGDLTGAVSLLQAALDLRRVGGQQDLEQDTAYVAAVRRRQAAAPIRATHPLSAWLRRLWRRLQGMQP
jgi:tetratricopeptide (TPR) repeat protein